MASTGKSIATVSALLAMSALAAASGCGARTGLDVGLEQSGEPNAETPVECPEREVNRLRLGAVEQMDLLFVVDSSVSMADKQELLKDAVPPLVTRLINPFCVDPVTGETQAVDSPDAPCPEGTDREFQPLEDLHIGLITTSIGAHGGQVCGVFSASDSTPDDRARLLPSARSGLPSYEGLGFLAWDPRGNAEPPGESDAQRLEADFLSHVSAVGDRGCGFEAPLEALYRFLIDPAPPESVALGDCPNGGTGCSQKIGTDATLLAQRRAFLRPDSVVAILILSDENDCSIVDEGQGFLPATLYLESGETFRMPRSTSTCATDVNSPCCRTCATFETRTPAGCVPLDQDPECQGDDFLSEEEDQSNLRCFDQKRRFGVDFLYPTARYVVGLREPVICPESVYRDADCLCRGAREAALRSGQPEPPCGVAETGEPVQNPLYSNLTGEAAFTRDPSQVFLAGIVGIPWQNLATEETILDPDKLEYLEAAELAELDPTTGLSRWDLILGNPELGVAGDPFLIESVTPRSGQNPITGQPILPPAFQGPLDTINGHEYANPDARNLQFACIFELDTPRDCGQTDAKDPSCDCSASHDPTNPLCQAPSGATAENHQYFAKAFPSRRLLQVLRDYGENSVTASICPKITGGGETDLGPGYRPAVASLVKRLRCASLDTRFESDPTSIDYGKVPCSVVAVTQGGDCACSGPGRFPASPRAREEVIASLRAQGSCGGETAFDCESYCTCELAQLSGPALESCQSDSEPSGQSGALNGWCYVDPGEGFGSSEAVGSCPSGHQKNVRVLGGASPAEDETLYSVCVPSCASE